MKKIKIKKLIAFLLAGLILFNSFQGTATFAEEVNSENVQTEVTNDTTNTEQEQAEQTENVEQQDSTNTEENTSKAENKDENDDERTESNGTQSQSETKESIDSTQSEDEGTAKISAVVRGDGDTVIGSEKEMAFYAGVKVSGVDTQFNDSYLILSVPANNIYDFKASSGAALKNDPIVERKNDNYEIRYDYSNLSGGMKIELPVTFKIGKYSKELDYRNYWHDYFDFHYMEVPIKATLYDSDGNIQSEKQYTFSSGRRFFVDDPYYFDKALIDQNYIAGATHTPTDVATAPEKFYKNCQYYIYGNTKPDAVRIKAILKEGVVYDEEKNRALGWSYDKDTRTATYIENSPIKDDYNKFNIYLKFPNWPYDTSKTAGRFSFEPVYNGEKFNGDVYKGSGKYFSQTIIGSKAIRRDIYIYDKGISIDQGDDFKKFSYSISQTLPYREQNKERIIWKKYNIYDSAYISAYPDEGDGTYTSNFYINKIVLPKYYFDLNYQRLYVDGSTIKNENIKNSFKNNILYGIKKDGTKVEITKNIELDQDVKISSQTKTENYKSIQLEFPEGFNIERKLTGNSFDTKCDFNMYIGAKLFEEDWEKYNPSNYTGSLEGAPLSDEKIYYSDEKGGTESNKDIQYYYNGYTSKDYQSKLYIGDQRVSVSFPWQSSYSYDFIEGDYNYLTTGISVSRPGSEYSEDEKKHIKNGKVYYLLPNGLQHASSKKTYISYKNSKKGKYDDIEVNPKKIDNYKNTGKTAYIFELPELEDWDDSSSAYVYFPVVSDGSGATQDIYVYFSWENNGKGELDKGNATDIYDMNENGNTGDILCKSREIRVIQKYGQHVSFYASAKSYSAIPNKEFYVRNDVRLNRYNLATKRYIKNGKMYYVIPEGYEYTSNKKAYIEYYDKETAKREKYEVKPEIITNSKIDGKTVYVINLPDIENLENWDDQNSMDFYFPLCANENAKVGSVSMHVYFAWDNNSADGVDAPSSYDYREYDRYDLNNDGKTSDVIYHSDVPINFNYDQQVQFSMSGNANMMLGEYRNLGSNFHISRLNSEVEKRYLKNAKMYYIVPEGYEYAKGQRAYIKFYTKKDDNNRRETIELDITPKAIYNFKNTGKTAYVISLPNLSKMKNWDDEYYYNYLQFPVRPTANAPQGQATVECYFSWDNNEDRELQALNGVLDDYDLNENGRTDDKVCKYNYNINFVSTIEVAGVHRVGTTLDGLNGSGSSIDLGSKFYYGMDILNLQNDTTVKSLSIMEVLPYKNDKSIIPDKTGAYTNRESQYRVHINGPVKVLKDGNLIDPEDEGYEVVYSTETPENEGFSANLNKTFKKDVTDWSKVTMFKITMKQGTVISEKGSMRFVVEALVPDDDSIADEDIAQASFAYVSSSMAGANFQPSNYIETTSIASQVARYQISGNVYMDYNINGSHDTDEKVFSGLKVGLYDEDDKKVQGTNTDEDGNYVFDFLTRGNYTVKLEEKPAGMAYPDEANHYDDIFPVAPQTRVAATGKNSLDKTGSSEVLTMDPDTKKRNLEMGYEVELEDLEVEKQWLGPEGSNSVDVTLHGLDQEKKLSVTADKGWNDRFIHLRKVDENGRPIIYTLTEDTDIEGYKKQIEKQDGKFTVKNINTEKVNVPVEVRWIGKESKDTEITLVETQTKQTVNADSHWQYDFTDLYKYDQGNGNEISYTIEAKDIEGYTKEITGDMTNGYVITYTNVEKIKVPVTVKWLGKEGQETEITLVQENNRQVVNADDNWKYSFKNLFKYDQTTGEAINYTIEAKDVEGYTKEITGDVTKGFVVIYRDQEKRNVSVSKQWVGEEKENVTVHLLKEGNKEETMTLDSTNSWQGEFKDLYKYDQEDGHIIEYTVEEDEVEGYKTGISGNMDLGYTITNTITGRVSIPVTKEFIGPQIENVTVDLYANDVKVDSIELNDTNQWQYTFTDKEKYEDGKEIVYTIKEHDIKNYKSKITGNALDGYVITNTNVEKREIPVKIKWIGKEGQETEVILVQEKDKQNITADNDWKYSFKGLYQYDQETGEEINYTIKAKDIDGYRQKITGDKERWLCCNVYKY